MNIRTASRFDFAGIELLLKDYFLESSYGNHIDLEIDSEHVNKILFTVMHAGKIWIAENLNEIVGILAVIREPNIWYPTKLTIKEFIWYVKPSARESMAAGRLFLTYTKWAEEQKQAGKVEAYFMSDMTTTRGINLEKRGFRLVERLYIKD